MQVLPTEARDKSFVPFIMGLKHWEKEKRVCIHCLTFFRDICSWVMGPQASWLVVVNCSQKYDTKFVFSKLLGHKWITHGLVRTKEGPFIFQFPHVHAILPPYLRFGMYFPYYRNESFLIMLGCLNIFPYSQTIFPSLLLCFKSKMHPPKHKVSHSQRWSTWKVNSAW